MKLPLRLVGDALAHSGGYVASMLIAFALVPFLLRAFSAADYGIWLVSLSASAALGTLTIALWWLVNREVAGADEHGDPPRALVADVLLTTLIVGCVGGLLLAIGGANGWISEATSDEQRNVLRLAGAAFFWEQIAACASAVLAGRRRFAVLNAIVVATNALRAVSIVFVLSLGGRLITVALFHVAFSALGAVALLGAMFRSAPWLRALRPVVPFSALRSRLRFAVQLQLASIVAAGTWQLVPLIVSRMFGSAAVVPLYIGLRVPQAIGLLANRVAEVTYPLLVQATNRGGLEAVRDVVIRGTRWTVALAIPGFVALILGAPFILQYWLGTYPPDALILFRLAALGYMFEAISIPMACALTAAGRTGTVLLLACCSALVHLGVLIWLLRSLGVRAAGVALVVSCVVNVVAYFVAADRIGITRWRSAPA